MMQLTFSAGGCFAALARSKLFEPRHHSAFVNYRNRTVETDKRRDIQTPDESSLVTPLRVSDF